MADRSQDTLNPAPRPTLDRRRSSTASFSRTRDSYGSYSEDPEMEERVQRGIEVAHNAILGKTQNPYTHVEAHGEDNPELYPGNRDENKENPVEEPTNYHWHSGDSEEYDMVDEIARGQPPGMGIKASPELGTYHFPGTWTSAYHSTTEATSNLTSAGTAFAKDVLSSGVAQAGKSIAQASVATSSAATNYVGAKVASAIGPNLEMHMPGFAQRWLRAADDHAKDTIRKRLEVERKRLKAKEEKPKPVPAINVPKPKGLPAPVPPKPQSPPSMPTFGNFELRPRLRGDEDGVFDNVTGKPSVQRRGLGGRRTSSGLTPDDEVNLADDENDDLSSLRVDPYGSVSPSVRKGKMGSMFKGTTVKESTFLGQSHESSSMRVEGRSYNPPLPTPATVSPFPNLGPTPSSYDDAIPFNRSSIKAPSRKSSLTSELRTTEASPYAPSSGSEHDEEDEMQAPVSESVELEVEPASSSIGRDTTSEDMSTVARATPDDVGIDYANGGAPVNIWAGEGEARTVVADKRGDDADDAEGEDEGFNF